MTDDLRIEKALANVRSFVRFASGKLPPHVQEDLEIVCDLAAMTSNETKVTRSDEALLREALEEARQLLWHFKQEAPLECQPPYPQLSAALAKIDAALNPPGVE